MIICSGLVNNQVCCEKRNQCANYVHWTLDRRSEFNACGIGSFKHFSAITVAPIMAIQNDLFAGMA